MQPPHSNRRRALLALLALVAAYLVPFAWKGELFYPHDNALELGLVRDEAESTGARKYSDASSVFVPEIHHHLHGERAGWISLWNPHVELGRPTAHISGLSPAWLPMRALLLFTDDAFVAFTLLGALTLVLGALFAFLFLDALGLHPWACFAGAAGIALGVFSVSWLTFVMFVAGLTWTCCLLWLTIRFVEKRTLARGLGLAFATYSLFLTAYPQQIVWHAYLLVAFALVRVWAMPAASVATRLRTLAGLAAWVALGLACMAPVYLDIALAAARSARVDTGVEFFLERMPPAASLADRLSILAQAVDAFAIADPFANESKLRFAGVCWTPLFAGLALACLAGGVWRRAWLWLAFSAVGFAMTLFPPLYGFGIEHLGLSLSRFLPLAGVWIPVIVCAALAVDHALRVGFERRVVACALAIVPALLAPAWAWHTASELRSEYALAGLASALGVAALLWTRRAAILCTLVAASVLVYANLSTITMKVDTIARTSPLIERMRAETASGTRYACIGMSRARLLPPNQEILFGLASIHTYNSLSPKIFQAWARRVSDAGTQIMGRLFRRVASPARLTGAEISRAAIGLVVSPEALRSPELVDAGEIEGVRLYRPRTAPLLEGQMRAYTIVDGESVRLAASGPLQSDLPVARREQADDERTFEVTPDARETLLFVSQQFHPQWQASVDGAEAKTVIVDDFYQGVLLPPGARSVTLRFCPWARWSFVPHVFFAAAALLCLVAAQRRSTRRAA